MNKHVSKEHAQSERLGYMLKRAQHALRIGMDSLLEPTGLSTPQYNVLSAIELEPGISNAALARGAFVTAQSMVELVLNLERAGFIQRTGDPNHGRIRRTELTQSGKAVLAKAHKLLADVEERMMSDFNRKERNDFHQLLRRCIQNLDKNFTSNL